MADGDIPSPSAPATPSPASGAQLFGASPTPVQGSDLFGNPSPQPAQNGDQVFGSPTPSGGILDKISGMAAQGAAMRKAVGAPDLNLTIQPDSLAGKALRIAAIPLRAATGAIVAAGAVANVPGANELHQKLNPGNSLIPDAYASDISDFYIDKAAKAAGIDQMQGTMGDVARGMITVGKMGIGLGANYLLDPMTGIKIGQLTQEAEAIQKVGGKVLNPAEVAQGKAPLLDTQALNSPAATARNLVSVKAPFSSATLDVQGLPVQQAISKLANNPVLRGVGTMIKSLSPDTGDAIIDQAGKTYDNLKRGDAQDLNSRYALPKDALNMTDDENKLASALVESTSNLKPNVPQDMLDAAEKRIIPGQSTVDGNPNFWNDEPTLRRNMSVIIDDKAQELGIEIAPGRDEAITEAAMMAKRAGAENIEDKYHAGVLNQANIADKVMENHLPRVMNPSYQGVSNVAEYEAKLAADADEVKKTTSGTFLSSQDPTRQRAITSGMSLDEANTQMKQAKGLDDYFITDPVKASVARLIESKKLLRDSQYLDVVKDAGERMKPGAAKQAGLAAIDHPELSGKTVVIKGENGSTQIVRHQDLVYPQDIASKVQSRLAPPPLTGFQKTLSDYNKVFRSVLFATSPGIRIGNTLDNMFKAMAVSKDYIQASKDALAVLAEKSQGFRSEPTVLKPNGTFYSGAALKGLLDKYGITKTGAWAEGMEPFLQSGKNLTLQQAMQRPGELGIKFGVQQIKNLVKVGDTFGESGENSARAALFLDRLRSGWEPQQAANEVTKWLFDYNRNSPAMQDVRMVMPFLQHPLKTAMIAPELLGTAAGAYNFIQNTMPHVVSNAFHDPVTQKQVNAILPDYIKQRDPIAGPFISGNTWMAKIFTDGKSQNMAWFDPRIGMRILNHFDYFSKGGTDRMIGELSPVLQGLVGFGSGRGDFGKTLDYANGNVNVANRASYLIAKTIGGVSPFPNTEKMIMQSFGMVDPKHVEPNSVLIMKGLAGQFGGITDLDKDVQSKLLSTHYAYEDQKKQLMTAVKTELGNNMNSGTLQRFVKSQYANITATSPTDLYKQMTQTEQEGQEASISAQALKGSTSVGDYVSRMKGLSQEMQRLNLSYQTMGARMLQMHAKTK